MLKNGRKVQGRLSVEPPNPYVKGTSRKRAALYVKR